MNNKSRPTKKMHSEDSDMDDCDRDLIELAAAANNRLIDSTTTQVNDSRPVTLMCRQLNLEDSSDSPEIPTRVTRSHQSETSHHSETVLLKSPPKKKKNKLERKTKDNKAWLETGGSSRDGSMSPELPSLQMPTLSYHLRCSPTKKDKMKAAMKLANGRLDNKESVSGDELWSHKVLGVEISNLSNAKTKSSSIDRSGASQNSQSCGAEMVEKKSKPMSSGQNKASPKVNGSDLQGKTTGQSVDKTIPVAYRSEQLVTVSG